MNKQFVKIGDKEFPRVCDTTLIGNWEEVQGIPAETINKNLGTEKLDGLIINGYEMKWNETNGNGERYEQVVNIWSSTTDAIQKELEDSGARLHDTLDKLLGL